MQYSCHARLGRTWHRYREVAGNNVLCRGHAGVPIVLEFDFQSKPARSTVAEVYAQVISDLNQAVTLITSSQKNAGYF